MVSVRVRRMRFADILAALDDIGRLIDEGGTLPSAQTPVQPLVKS